MNYENLKQEDLEEEVKIKVSKNAFKTELHCDECNIKMKKVVLDMDIPDSSITIHFEAFKCPKCEKEYLNGEQAEKLDEILVINKIVTERAPVYERAGNFDGHNWFVRFPSQLTKNYGRHVKTEIKQLSATDFLVHFKKSN